MNTHQILMMRRHLKVAIATYQEILKQANGHNDLARSSLIDAENMMALLRTMKPSDA